MSTIRCSICERYFDTATTDAMPFCSKRCKQIDLGRWFGERYSVPVEPKEEDDEDEGPPRHASDGED